MSTVRLSSMMIIARINLLQRGKIMFNVVLLLSMFPGKVTMLSTYNLQLTQQNKYFYVHCSSSNIYLKKYDDNTRYFITISLFHHVVFIIPDSFPQGGFDLFSYGAIPDLTMGTSSSRPLSVEVVSTGTSTSPGPASPDNQQHQPANVTVHSQGSMNRFHITHFGGLMPPSTSPNESSKEGAGENSSELSPKQQIESTPKKHQTKDGSTGMQEPTMRR